jgi:hypothetical protein
LVLGLAFSLVTVIGYVTWLYRQGSFPASRLRREARRAARRARELDREDARFEPPAEEDPGD